MALFYRSDLFEQNGIAVPTTWEEYRDAAVKIRAPGGYITNFSQTDINQFAGFVWQAGGAVVHQRRRGVDGRPDRRHVDHRSPTTGRT